MIEFTLTEIVLLAWAGIATGVAMHYREQERNHKRFVCTLIENKDLREEFYSTVDNHIEEHKT
jgi:hypothetical protein